MDVLLLTMMMLLAFFNYMEDHVPHGNGTCAGFARLVEGFAPLLAYRTSPGLDKAR